MGRGFLGASLDFFVVIRGVVTAGVIGGVGEDVVTSEKPLICIVSRS